MLTILNIIKDDLNSLSRNSFKNKILNLFFNRSFALTLNYRLGNHFQKKRNFLNNLFILILKKKQLKNFGCDISYTAEIGKNISFPHPIGIVIGNNVKIKDNVKIWQNVTIGSKGKLQKEYPVINSNVKIFTSAQVIGNIYIGDNTIIGASSLVITDLPSNSIAYGVPAKFKINENS
ncbi:serine acetyltransferase [Mesonia sp.]|uniref:serine acetyltransferase n=1 Tax=Mesonia sp. TaxID=1960830 RepID=UPI001770ECF1|nr:serine acetyltransferase [Mesonia sp.]HIB38450.1 serine acetyltransferase [Mesonia sp.]